MRNKKILIIIIFLLSLSLVSCIMKKPDFGSFNVDIKTAISYGLYETDRGFLGDGTTLKYFHLYDEDYIELKKQLKDYNSKEISENKTEYIGLLDKTFLKLTYEGLSKVNGYYYFINTTPNYKLGEPVGNFEMLILDEDNQSIIYIKSDS